MNKVIHFSKIRFYMIALSVLLIVAGFIGTVVNDGFNFGIDFQAGLSQRFQIASPGMEVTYEGGHNASLNVVGGVVQIEVQDQESTNRWSFAPDEYPTMGELAAGISEISNMQAEAADSQVRTEDLATGLGLPYILGEDPVVLNVANTDTQNYVGIEEIRRALGEFESLQVQVAGSPHAQEYMVRVQEDGAAQDQIEAKISGLIESEFGENTFVLKQSDFVGPRFSEALARQSIMLVFVALILILAYVWFRFRLGYAVSSITALAHDILFMLAFIGAFQIEVNTATLAAVLTIIGYSLNDTIVVFDRIRENSEIMKDRPFRLIVDTSITKSLSRTLITSVTTLLAVTALFIFGTGMIRDFALNLIVGVIVGTYSSIFIASPVLIGWVQRAKRKHAKHLGRTFNEHEDPLVEQTVTSAPVQHKAQTAGKQAAPAQQQKEAEVPTAERRLKGKRQQQKKKK